jgi:hypothetical protein
MKNILFLTDLVNEEDVLKLKESLGQTRIDFEISLAQHCVIIEGGNDLVYTAKVAIREAGFTVE